MTQAEQQAERADAEAAHQQRPAVRSPRNSTRRQIRQDEVSLRRRSCARRAGLSPTGSGARSLRRRAACRQPSTAQRPSRPSRSRDHDRHARPSLEDSSGRSRSSPDLAHKGADYTRTRRASGSAMPPVRKMRMPSSTVMSGSSRGRVRTNHDVAEIQVIGRHVDGDERLGPLPRSTVNSRVRNPSTIAALRPRSAPPA